VLKGLFKLEKETLARGMRRKAAAGQTDQCQTSSVPFAIVLVIPILDWPFTPNAVP